MHTLQFQFAKPIPTDADNSPTAAPKPSTPTPGQADQTRFREPGAIYKQLTAVYSDTATPLLFHR